MTLDVDCGSAYAHGTAATASTVAFTAARLANGVDQQSGAACKSRGHSSFDDPSSPSDMTGFSVLPARSSEVRIDVESIAAIIVSAVIGLGTALATLFVGYRSGLMPVQQALVTALKDRVDFLEKENARQKIELARLEAENQTLRNRVDRLEQLFVDRKLDEARPPL